MRASGRADLHLEGWIMGFRVFDGVIYLKAASRHRAQKHGAGAFVL